MSKTTFLGYVPSLKEKHEATIVEGKAIESKGGSIRYTLRGEYKGRKTLPKTVTKADFESVYGFDAKAAEAVIIQGKKGKEDAVQLHIVGIEDKTDFAPEKIVPIKTMNEYGHKKLTKEIMGGHATKSNHADTVGNPSPASVEPPAPSETPFPQEPSNENFSAEAKDEDRYYHIYTYPQKWIDEDGWEGFYTDGKRERGYDFGLYEEIKDTYQEAVNYVDERNKESPLAFAAIWEWDATEGKQKGTLDGEYTDNYNEIINTDPDSLNENFSAEYTEDDICFVCSNPDTENEVTYCESDADCGKAICDDCRYEEMQGGKWVKLDEDPEDDNSAMADVCRECADNNEPVLFEAFGLFEDKEEDAEPEEEKPKAQEFTVVLQEGDKLELTDIEEDIPEEMEPKEEDNTEDEENDEKEAEEGTRTFKITDIWYDTYDEEAEGMQGIKPFHDKHGYKQSHDQPEPSEMTITLDEDEGWEDRDLDMELGDAVSDESGFCVYHYNWDEVKVKEAVSAKVTRPVKEEEKEEEDEGEGMSTLMKVGLGVGALAVGAAILGAEDEGESDYWAGENAHWRAESVGEHTKCPKCKQMTITDDSEGYEVCSDSVYD